jgi:hypothetical protein
MVPAKRSRQNHAQHVLAVAKAALEQERSPAAMSDQRNFIIISLWWNKNTKTNKRQLLCFSKHFPYFCRQNLLRL